MSTTTQGPVTTNYQRGLQLSDSTTYHAGSSIEWWLTKRVNQLCKEADMTVSDLAETAGLDHSALTFILMGQAEWSLSEALAVSEALGMTMSNLFRQAQALANTEDQE